MVNLPPEVWAHVLHMLNETHLDILSSWRFAETCRIFYNLVTTMYPQLQQDNYRCERLFAPKDINALRCLHNYSTDVSNFAQYTKTVSLVLTHDDNTGDKYPGPNYPRWGIFVDSIFYYWIMDRKDKHESPLMYLPILRMRWFSIPRRCAVKKYDLGTTNMLHTWRVSIMNNFAQKLGDDNVCSMYWHHMDCLYVLFKLLCNDTFADDIWADVVTKEKDDLQKKIVSLFYHEDIVTHQWKLPNARDKRISHYRNQTYACICEHYPKEKMPDKECILF